MDVLKLLTTLAAKRPLFHSEADFQHAFAWELQLYHPDAKVRLEYRPSVMEAKMYVDVWSVLPDKRVLAFELKYKTRQLDMEIEGESYRLLNQGAHLQARYDFVYDVWRLEQLTAKCPSLFGAAVLLTNDSSYWSEPRGSKSVDAAYRLHEGRALAGELSWDVAASAGTKSGRETPISLLSPYSAAWANYSALNASPAGEFRYLLFNVQSGHARPAS